MANILELPTFGDDRGALTIVEKILPFEIKRLYYIYGADSKRGGHRHKITQQALISINGSCEIFINNGASTETILLDRPDKCLILDKDDWHTMDKFTEGCVLLVLASAYYNVDDYIDEEY